MLEIPKLDSPYLRYFHMCGTLSGSQHQELLNEVGKSEKVAKLGESDTYVRLVGARKTRLRHLHIDIVRAMAFASAPEVTSSVEDIQRVLDQLKNEEYEANFNGRFVCPLDKLSPTSLLRRMMFTVKSETYGITQVGGRFELTGLPIAEVEWEVADNEIRTELSFQQQTKLDGELLAQVMSQLEATHKALAFSLAE